MQVCKEMQVCKYARKCKYASMQGNASMQKKESEKQDKALPTCLSSLTQLFFLETKQKCTGSIILNHFQLIWYYFKD